MKTLIAGYEISNRQKRITSDDPAYVSMRKLGRDRDDGGYFTPDEARALAAALITMADDAEAKS